MRTSLPWRDQPPGAGVTEEVDLVRTECRLVLHTLEVDSGEVKELSYQQGFASPTTAHRRRAALGQLVRAAFQTLWWRAERV